MSSASATPDYTDLRDVISFPSFPFCPHENDVPDTYYELRRDSVFSPIRHWCFPGEIEHVDSFTRLRLWVKDKDANEVVLHFHLDPPTGNILSIVPPGGRGLPSHSNLPHALIKEGNTVALLYGAQHDFMDMSTGFRIESADCIQLFPCSLQKLLSLSDQIRQHSNPSESRACNKCGETSATLQRCGRCRLVCYCNKDCQTADWTSGHKKDCKLNTQVLELMRQDWNNFHGFWSFPLPKYSL